MQVFDQVLPSPTQSLQYKELMQVFDQMMPSPTQCLNQRLCLCSTEGITEKKERLQKETSEPERIKIQKNRGSERTEEI